MELLLVSEKSERKEKGEEKVHKQSSKKEECAAVKEITKQFDVNENFRVAVHDLGDCRASRISKCNEIILFRKQREQWTMRCLIESWS